MKPFISIREFAKTTGINYKLARRLVLSGAVPSRQIGRRRRISTRWLERWLEESATVTQDDMSAEMTALR
jgi:excisionase family DNA binding protein